MQTPNLPAPLSALPLDHIGVAVESLAETLAFYQLLGLEVLKTETVPTEAVNVAFLNTGECHLELLEPTSEESPIARFIQKRGPGIHHICLKVNGIEALLQKLDAAGVRLIDKTPRPGANQKKVAFVHPKATGGVLLELSEDAASPSQSPSDMLG